MSFYPDVDYCYCKHKERKPEKEECCCEIDCCRQAEVNASTGTIGPLPIITTPLTQPIPITSVSIDTLGMCETDNLLTFTGFASLPLGAVVTLNFQIFRSINGGTPVPIGSTFTLARTAAVLETDFVAFQVFDNDVEQGFVTYTVSLTNNSLVTVAAGATVTGTLSVLAVKDE